MGRSDTGDKVIDVRLGDVFDAEIINHESEGNRSGVVDPKTRGINAFGVSEGC